jgi:hypothetical protein
MRRNDNGSLKVGRHNVGAHVTTDEFMDFLRRSRDKGADVLLDDCTIVSAQSAFTRAELAIDGEGAGAVNFVNCHISNDRTSALVGPNVTVTGGTIAAPMVVRDGAMVNGVHFRRDDPTHPTRGIHLGSVTLVEVNEGCAVRDCTFAGAMEIAVQGGTLTNPEWTQEGRRLTYEPVTKRGGRTSAAKTPRIVHDSGKITIEQPGWVVQRSTYANDTMNAVERRQMQSESLAADLDRTFVTESHIDITKDHQPPEKISFERRRAAALPGDTYIGSRNAGAWRAYLDFRSRKLEPDIVDMDAVKMAIAMSPN